MIYQDVSIFTIFNIASSISAISGTFISHLRYLIKLMESLETFYDKRNSNLCLKKQQSSRDNARS